MRTPASGLRSTAARLHAIAVIALATTLLSLSHTTPAAAEELRPLRIQKVADVASHPEQSFYIHLSVNPTQESEHFLFVLAADVRVSAAVEVLVPTSGVSVFEGPQDAGWSRGGYALLPDPAGTAQCSPSLSYGPDYSHISVPDGAGRYLVCVRNTYTMPDVELADVTVVESALTSLKYSFRIVNRANSSLNPGRWKLESWLSRDDVLDPGVDILAEDIFLTAAPLLPGGEAIGDVVVAPPPGSSIPGRPYLIVRIVTGYPEADEANNAISQRVSTPSMHRLIVPAVVAACEATC